MKKLLMLPLVALFFTACSTDSMVNEDTTSVVITNPAIEENKPVLGCFETAAGSFYVDVTNGLGNPTVVFMANVTGQYGSLKKEFTVTLQLQPLSECEDMNSDSGSVIAYSAVPNPVKNPQVNVPSVSLTRSSLPSVCYKWRFVLEGGIVGSDLNPYCQTVTPWYDAPLF